MQNVIAQWLTKSANYVQSHYYCSDVFIVNFEHILAPVSSISIVDFDHVNICWVHFHDSDEGLQQGGRLGLNWK